MRILQTNSVITILKNKMKVVDCSYIGSQYILDEVKPKRIPSM